MNFKYIRCQTLNYSYFNYFTYILYVYASNFKHETVIPETNISFSLQQIIDMFIQPFIFRAPC